MLMIHTPYRVCPLGAHVDHQNGLVTGFALDHGITLTYETTSNGSIEITSENFGGEVKSTVRSVTDRQMHWGDYARAAVATLLNDKYELVNGFRGEIKGNLPIGGLSSSASVIITYIRAIAEANGILLSQDHLIALSHWAETRYIGLNNGLLDQSCEVYGKKNNLLYLDTLDGSHELIPVNPAMANYEVLIVFSGIEHALINSSYNARVDECKAAAYALKAFAGIPYEKISDTRLRDVPEDVFVRYKDRLPVSWAKRAKHYYSEVRRVRQGVEAWKKGDMQAFGQIVFESGSSSINSYEAGSPELKKLHEIAMHTDGVYGGRFSGAGFMGCYMALIDPAYRECVSRIFSERYLALYPEMKKRLSIHYCKSADGVQLDDVKISTCALQSDEKKKTGVIL